MATLKDIANRTGVSLTTVSLVLNDRVLPGRVSEGKKKEILSTARQLNYVPNLRARSMVTHKARTIGVISTMPFDPREVDTQSYIFSVLAGVEEVCKSMEYHCLFSFHNEHTIESFIKPRAMQDGSVDGVVLLMYTNKAVIEKIAAIGLPCVHIGTNIDPGTGVPCVYGDLDRAFEQAVSHLRDLGHSKICLLLSKGPGPEILASNFRALKSKFPDVDTEAVLLGNTIEQGEDAYDYAKKMVTLPDPPSAFILGSAKHLAGLNRGLSESGRECPRDYSIMVNTVPGIVPPMTTSNISASTIEVPVWEVGRNAAKVLLAKLGELKQGSAKDISPSIPCNIIYRDSCGTKRK